MHTANVSPTRTDVKPRASSWLLLTLMLPLLFPLSAQWSCCPLQRSMWSSASSFTSLSMQYRQTSIDENGCCLNGGGYLAGALLQLSVLGNSSLGTVMAWHGDRASYQPLNSRRVSSVRCFYYTQYSSIMLQQIYRFDQKRIPFRSYFTRSWKRCVKWLGLCIRSCHLVPVELGSIAVRRNIVVTFSCYR